MFRNRPWLLASTLIGAFLALSSGSKALAVTGTLTAQDQDSQINIRQAPSTRATALHYGLPGDRVTVLRVAAGEGNYTWFYVRFAQSGAEGWVRQDLITVPAGESIPLGQLAEGYYSIGPTGVGLEIAGSRYRGYDEESQQPWQPLSQIVYVRDGVVFDGQTYWCALSQYPDTIATCTPTGWEQFTD